MAWQRDQAYGHDLRDRVLACSELDVTRGGAPVRRQLRLEGKSPAAPPGRRHARAAAQSRAASAGAGRDALRAQVKADPDAVLRELREWVEQQHGIRVSHPVMWTVVAQLA